MNIIIVSGNIGHTPEQRMTAAGKRVCDFSLAIDTEQRDQPAQWVKVICWEKQAEFVERFLGKGRKVLVTGRLQLREYEGRDGTKKTAVEVVAQKVDFMDSRPPEQRESAPERPAHDNTHQRNGQLKATIGRASSPAGGDDWTDDRVPF